MPKGNNKKNGNKNNQDNCNDQKQNDQKGKKDKLKELFGKELSPEQLAVIAALLTNTLSVDSVQLDRDQNVQIVLGGSLRQKTKMDRLLDEMSGLTIADLLDSIKHR